ncbi:hypothetical protein JXC34_00480 [Candidatus Woesearchaeota archaeon]|nr:hypothetical protein [Candidatus Woesearchaeota archaeon]
MINSILSVIGNMAIHLVRRGKGIFKILFFVDDFFRLFTMTILIPIFFNWLGFGNFLVQLGLVLGIIIDVHDFISEFGIGKL